MKIKLKSKSKNETILFGKKIGKVLKVGDIITLTGDLGAGKTTFTSGVAKALNIKEDILSPTFNILKCYFDAKIPLYHIDAYRLESVNKDIGLEEYIEGNGVAIIEWPNFIKELLNKPHLEINIKNVGDDNREINIIIPNDDYLKRIKGAIK